MKKTSIGDVVFFMVATTVCYLAIFGRMGVPEFLSIATLVFGAYYIHKSKNQNTPDDKQP